MPSSANGARFAWVSGDAIFDHELSNCDKVVFTALATFADKQGFCIRSQVKLARELGIARTTLNRAIKRLVQRGWLLITEGVRPDGGRCSHTYQVLKQKNGATQGELETAKPPERNRDFLSKNEHGVCSQRNNHNNNLQKTKREEDNSADSEADLEQGREKGKDRKPEPEPQSPAQGGTPPASEQDAERRYIEKAVQALALIGLDLQSGELHGGTGPLSAWFQAGYDLKIDILPAVLRVLKKAPSRVRSLKYFNRAVMATHRARIEAAERCSRDFLHIGSVSKQERAHQREMARALAEF